MDLTLDKLSRRIQALAPYRYRQLHDLTEFTVTEDPNGLAGTRPVNLENSTVLRVGDTWEGRDRYLWFSTPVPLPVASNESRVVGVFDLGSTGSGNNAGFEALLFVNGDPYQGVDSNHREVFFAESLLGTTVNLAFRVWSGLEGGGPLTTQHHQIKAAAIGILDQTTDDLYFTALAVLQSVRVLTEADPVGIHLLKILDRSIELLNWTDTGSEAFYESVSRASTVLHSGLDDMKEPPAPVTVHSVGHTHIDVAWLWRLKHTREKTARSFSTVLRLMEQFPDYLFFQSQPQLYAYLQEDYPALFEQVAARVQEGRWEPGGAMWLEADCNLPSGESLVRQILMGTRFFQQHFGQSTQVLWLPDAFGFSWALPQILVKSGIKSFMTTKLSWNQTNRMPHDTFLWRGMDGSEVLAHFITTPPSATDPRATYNGDVTAESVTGIWRSYQDKALNQDLLLSYGWGDGGGGPTREMLEMRRRLEHMPGISRVVPGHVKQYFQQLTETLNESDQYVHTWDGELYLEYHRGTYTAQGRIKRMNRKLELRLRTLEWMGVLAMVQHQTPVPYPAESLHQAWQILLRNQFHDILPGSSIGEVYEDAHAEYEAAWTMTQNALTALTEKALSQNDSPPVFTVFNAAPWTRQDPVLLPHIDPATTIWIDQRGQRYIGQPTVGGTLLEGRVPSLGFATFRLATDKADPEIPFETADRWLKTPFYEVEWDPSGQIIRLYDRKAERDVLKEGEPANVFQLFEDKPLRFDAWDIDPFYQQSPLDGFTLTEFDVTEMGPIRLVYRLVWVGGKSRIEQDIVFYAHHRSIEFRTRVDWHQRQQLLKVAFPVAVRATEATYNIQFGNAKRPTHGNTSWDQARFETLAHQWVDLSEYDYGVSLLNDGKYGHDIKDHVIRLTLLKSPIYPDVDADQGWHEFIYALFPHPHSWQEAGTEEAAWQLNDPQLAIKGAPVTPESQSLFTFDGVPVMVDAIKKAEDTDQVVLRVHEYQGRRGLVTVTSDWPIENYRECDLMERPLGPSGVTKPFEFSIQPYEIKTFLVSFRAGAK